MRNHFVYPVFFLILIVSGCSTFSDLGTTNSASNDSVAGNTTETLDTKPTERYAPSGDPRADLQSLSERFLALKSMRANLEATGKNPMTMTVDFVQPDRFRLVSNMQNGQNVEMVIVGKTTYMKSGNGWQKIPVDLGTTMPDIRQNFTREGMNWIKDIKQDGEEPVDGRPAYIYSYESQMPEGGPGYSSRMWVSKDGGLPLKVETNYSSGDVKTMVIHYDYRTPITIEPPAGVRP